MKACKTLLLSIFLLFCPSVFSQTLNSSVTIRINRGNYIVAGVVSDESVKTEVVEKINARLGATADFSKLTVQPDAKAFQTDWRTELDDALLKIKGWQSGVFIFSNSKRAAAAKNYPPLADKIINARFSLADGQTVSLNDYKNKLVVLFFNEAWNSPGNRQAAELNKFYAGISSRRVEIISLSIETSADEKKRFRKLIEMLDIRYKTGWADEQLFRDFLEISKFPGIPQTFLILNGRIHAVFGGFSPAVEKKLEETIRETLDENDL